MICSNCRIPGRWKKEDYISSFWSELEKTKRAWHAGCLYPTTCTCQHRLTDFGVPEGDEE